MRAVLRQNVHRIEIGRIEHGGERRKAAPGVARLPDPLSIVNPLRMTFQEDPILPGHSWDKFDIEQRPSVRIGGICGWVISGKASITWQFRPCVRVGGLGVGAGAG
jgi:hypothetical protein